MDIMSDLTSPVYDMTNGISTVFAAAFEFDSIHPSLFHNAICIFQANIQIIVFIRSKGLFQK
jgi:hypothetical protein